MKLRELKLENFRNHESLELTCTPRGNVIVGVNGAGNTSVLEVHLGHESVQHAEAEA